MACGRICTEKALRTWPNAATGLIYEGYLGTPEGYLGSYVKSKESSVQSNQAAIHACHCSRVGSRHHATG